ncbi:hypothetical protein G6F60_015383 [Rhizopus arrhizus]|nr:hypothetical protein G6F60_015383 [Rhizopus arrhizus]
MQLRARTFQPAQGGRQGRYGNVFRQPDTHAAGAGTLAQPSRRRLAQRQDAVGVAQQQFAFGRGRHAAARTVQQPLAHHFFQPPDLRA